MTNNPVLLDISAPQIVIVAAGDSPSAQANARGHLFEKFVAKLFEAYGCEKPITKNINVRSYGYEVDIVTRFTLTDARGIAECKAYSSPLTVSDLNTFYAKLCTDRFDHKDTHGWFVAIPGLTKDGHELARKIEANDTKFKLITAYEIYNLVIQSNWINPIQATQGMVLSDEAILVTSTGVNAIAKQLDPASRLPTRVLVQKPNGIVSHDDINLIAATDYAGGLPVHDFGLSEILPTQSQFADLPKLFTVVGSNGDFEYQFPAAPSFFVGREDILAHVKKISDPTNTTGSVIVLNAQSGWGKSSLALRLAYQVEKSGGFSVVFDTRTADSASYVAAALRKAITDAVSNNKLFMPSEPSFASLQSSLTTLQASFSQGSTTPMLIFFDQFENVFRNARLTQEFRDLALGIREIKAPIIIGFSWKTDLVGLTESYPYQLRDEIRGAALVLNVEPFGPKEVGILLARLAKATGMPLSSDLRQRLREYSQGLPWLLKKLASHILIQIQAGTTEETLLAEALNIERLFEQDLSALETQEIEALKLIAREAPVPASDIAERVSPKVMQSLVDQRLIVKVGERLDTYWDTFREFLITGKVAIEDTYILRQRAPGTSNLLKYIVSSGGEVTALDISRELSISLNGVLNLSKDLRQLGILAPKSGTLQLAEQLRADKLTEQQLKDRVAKALRKHKVFSRLQQLLLAAPSQVISIDDIAKQMPTLFPAMEARSNTWKVYSLAFASWFDYAELMQLRGKLLCSPTSPSNTRLLGDWKKGGRRTFPQTRPKFALKFLHAITSAKDTDFLSPSTKNKAISDLQCLGIIDDAGKIANETLAASLLDKINGAAVLMERLNKVPGGQAALQLLKEQADASPEKIGCLLKEAYGHPWADSTTRMAGNTFRAWAVNAGIGFKKIGRRKSKEQADNPEIQQKLLEI